MRETSDLVMNAETWARVLAHFEAETGDQPSSKPDGWELCLLTRLTIKEVGLALRARRRTERLVLQECEGKSLEVCQVFLSQKLAAQTQVVECGAELEATIAACVLEVEDASRCNASSPASRRRSRSRGRDAVRRARSALETAMGSARRYPRNTIAAVGSLLRAGRCLERKSLQEGYVEVNMAGMDLAAPSCLGPPAFFPVGNAAGRHAPITRGLAVSAPRLLFVGLSDPRHLLSALLALPSGTHLQCVVNDLNAETCARNALIMALLARTGSRAMRLLAVFAVWWTHELPVALTPLLASTASEAAAMGACCPATTLVLQRWAALWSAPQAAQPASDLKSVFEATGLSVLGLADAACAVLQDGCIANGTLQHDAARLDYGLYCEHTPPEGWGPAGDGVLLWPEVPFEEEFPTDGVQPPRSDYLAALARQLPSFARTIDQIMQMWTEPGQLDCEYVAGDCLSLALRLTGCFHRIFTSNVADHVGVPALALSLGGLLHAGGELRASLSNNIRALDSQGEARSLVEKLHGISLEALAAVFGLQLGAHEDAEPDQVFLAAGPPDRPVPESLQQWPAECARRLYRCPPPDPETLRRRVAHGDCLGLACRYARRFTVSPVTVACIARLLERAAEALPEAAATAAATSVKEAAPHGWLRLSQCLRWAKLPEAVRAALAPEVQPCRLSRVSLELPRSRVPGWAWRTHPPVVLLWVRASGFESAAAAGVRLVAEDPVWGRCRTRRQLAFLDAGVWGPLRWALEASPEDVQVLDGLEVSLLASGTVRISFALPAVELEYGVGTSAFVLSLVDNAIVTGPHHARELRVAMP
mmetsp:Transcript_25191/g.79408  ORF Transcript_25191/g.79408 Transcript_25191/m.79408 type:complete len:820 (+) Transcript_25191:107-2566(+)